MSVKPWTSWIQLPRTEEGLCYTLRQTLTCSGPGETRHLPALLHLPACFFHMDLGPAWSQCGLWRKGDGCPCAQLPPSTMGMGDNPTLQTFAAHGWKRWDEGIHSHAGLDLSPAQKWWNAQTRLDTLWCSWALNAFKAAPKVLILLPLSKYLISAEGLNEICKVRANPWVCTLASWRRACTPACHPTHLGKTKFLNL